MMERYLKDITKTYAWLKVIITGGYAVKLLTGDYNTDDIDVKMIGNYTIKQQRKSIVGELVRQFQDKNAPYTLMSKIQPLTEEQQNTGEVPEKILKKIGGIPLVDITFIKKTYIPGTYVSHEKGFLIMPVNALINNLLDITRNVAERIAKKDETGESIFPEKIASWYLQ